MTVEDEPHAEDEDLGVAEAWLVDGSGRGRPRRVLALAIGLITAAAAGLVAGVAIGRTSRGPGPAITAAADRPGAAQVVPPPAAPTPSTPLLFDRTTPDGVRISAYLTTPQPPAGPACPPGAVCPPPPSGCPPSLLQVDLTAASAVQVARAQLPGPGAPLLGVLGAGEFGTVEGSPTLYVLAAVGGGVADVRATFSATDVDEMAPVDGVVVLAHAAPGSPGSPATTVRLDAVGPDGSTLATTKAEPGSPTAVATVATVNCPAPSPALPPPGQQPADPTAARAAIAKAYAVLDANAAGNTDAQLAYIQDGASILSALDEAGRRNNVSTQYPKVAWVVRAVVFTSPTRASVGYDITNADQVLLGGQIGEAVLDAGTWKVTRATVCAVLALGGTTCPPA